MFGYACIGLAVVGLHSFLTKTVFICSVRPLLVCIVFLRKLRIEEIQYICCKRRLQMFFCQACIFPNSRTFVSEVNEWHCKIVQLCVQQRFVCLSNKTSYNIYSVTHHIPLPPLHIPATEWYQHHSTITVSSKGVVGLIVEYFVISTRDD